MTIYALLFVVFRGISWFRGILGLSAEKFKARHGYRSGRIGSASAASNAGIPVELWGHHGD